jgi:hypothetical protein
MFSKLTSEPIKDRRELDEREQSGSTFFETGAHPTLVFDTTEQPFAFSATNGLFEGPPPEGSTNFAAICRLM